METLQRHIYNPPQMSIAELLNASVCAYMFAISFFISVHTQFLKKKKKKSMTPKSIKVCLVVAATLEIPSILSCVNDVVPA